MIESSELDTITNKIYSTKDVQEEIGLVKLALNMIEKTKDIEDTEYHYFIGFFWYLHPIKNQERFDNITYHLKKSLELDNSHDFSKFFLGCIYFDNKFYQEALHYYELIDTDYFTIEINQLWRSIKIEELIISCRIYLEDNFFIIEEEKITKLLRKHIYHYVTKYDMIALPTEIIISLFFRLQSYERSIVTLNIKKVISILIKLIEKAEIIDLYEEEYNFFMKIYSEPSCE